MGLAGYVGLRGPVKGTARTGGRPAPRRCGGRWDSRPTFPRRVEQLTQNWSGQGESDCLIKTKQSDGRNPVLTLCDFLPSALNVKLKKFN